MVKCHHMNTGDLYCRRYQVGSVHVLSAKGVGVAVISDPLAPGELYVIDMSFHKEQPELRKLTSMNDEWLSNVRLGSVQKIAFPCKDTREYTHIGHRAIR